MWARIVFFLFLFYYSLQISFWASQILLEVPKEAQMGEQFQIEAKLSFENSLEIQSIELLWVENFRKTSTEQRQEIRSFNGKTQAMLIFRIGLIWEKEGLYKIGPLKVQTASWNFESNVSSILITSWSSLSWNTSLSRNDLPYDIYPPRSEAWSFAPYSLLLFVWICIFIFLFLTLKKYLFSQEKESKTSSLIKELTREEKYIEKFRSIQLDQEKIEFYREFHWSLRSYFKELWIESIETMTYSDTKRQKIWKWNLAKFETIFKETYFDEFIPMGQENTEKRQQYIEKICSLLSQ